MMLTYRLLLGTLITLLGDFIETFNVLLEASQLLGAVRLLFLSLLGGVN